MIFQNLAQSLNPIQRVDKQVAAAIRKNGNPKLLTSDEAAKSLDALGSAESGAHA